MKKQHWNLLLEPNMAAPTSGVYLLAIRNDNHISYECRKMNEGDSFYGAIGASPSHDPRDWYVPIAYHFCNEYNYCTELNDNPSVTKNSWYQCNSDFGKDGIREIAFTVNGVLKYDFIYRDNCVSFAKRNSLTYRDGHLQTLYLDEYVDEEEEIKLVAYHYVDIFGEQGHSYWWDEYLKIHSSHQ